MCCADGFLVKVLQVNYGFTWAETRSLRTFNGGGLIPKHTVPVAEAKKKALTPVLNKKIVGFCNVLTQDQKACLSTPSYQKKKEKHDQKPSTKSPL